MLQEVIIFLSGGLYRPALEHASSTENFNFEVKALEFATLQIFRELSSLSMLTPTLVVKYQGDIFG